MSDLVGEIDIILHENKQLREQNRVLREALDTIACGTEDKIPPYRCIDFAMAKRIAQAALTATSQPQPPYKEWCRHPDTCAGSASCPQDPTCAD